MGKDSWAQQALAFKLLDAVLDLTGSVDGEYVDEGEQGLGMHWIMEVLVCLLGFHLFFSSAS